MTLPFIVDKISPLEKTYREFKNGYKKSAYVSLFNNVDEFTTKLCNLLSAVHSTKISAGNKLESFIYDEYNGHKYENMDFNDVVKKIQKFPDEMLVFKLCKITKEILNENSSYDHTRSKTLHLDFLVYHDNKIYVNELKDGYNFDTKKSNDEITEIKMVKETFENVTKMNCYASLILWTCKDLKDASVKSDEASDYIVRGVDFATKLNIDFNEVQNKRRVNNEGNYEYLKENIKQLADVLKDIDEKNKKNKTTL